MPDSPVTSYSDTTPQKRVITDVISLIDPYDTPFINAIGGLDGAAGKFRFANWPSTLVEWLEDTMPTLTGALSGSITSTATTITLADASFLQEGDIIEISTEQMWVSAVDTSTEVVTVTRNFAGTQVTVADAAAVTIVGMARLEGDDSDDVYVTDRTSGTNVTQIFHHEIEVSRTQRQMSQYGITDEFAYQGDKQVPGILRKIEKHLLQYKGAAKAGSATTPRVTAGLQGLITTNKLSGASLAQSQFENACLSVYNAGGSPNLVAILNPANFAKVKAWYDSTTVLRVDRTETTVGMVINRIETPYASVGLIMDRWQPSSLIPILDPNHIGLRQFYPLTQEPLAKTGDGDKAELVGELVFCLRQEKAHAMLTAVS